jgi:ATP-binding cassette subfamily B protein
VRDTLRSLAFVLRTAFRADQWRAGLTFALVPLIGLAAAAFGLWLKVLADAVAERDTTAGLLAAGGLAATVTLRHLLVLVVGKLRFVLQERTAIVLEVRLMELMTGLERLEHFEHPAHLDKLDHLRAERASLGQAVGVVAASLSVLAEAVGMAVLLASVHPALLLLPLLGLPSLVATRRAAAIVDEAKEASAEQQRLSRQLLLATTSLGPAKEIRLFGLGEELLARDHGLAAAVRGRQVRARVRAAVWEAGAGLLFVVGLVAAVALVLDRATRGLATPGDVLLAFRLATQVGGTVTGVADMAGALQEVLLLVSHFRWLEDHASAQAAGPRHPPPERLEQGIAFENVSFRYPGTGTEVLAGVNLRLRPGTVVALVGENGAGKSTFVKLLCGFYRPTTGRVTVDGIDLGDLDAARWRTRLSGVFQDFCKYDFLLREAVGIGDLARKDCPRALAAALHGAGASGVVAALPHGTGTQLGRTFGGTDLSEGQWQKLALARGRMRAEPLVLVLDEPNSALDPDSERALLARLSAIAADARRRGGITVLVSHRLSMARPADVIVVMDGGRITEIGSHDDLMARGELYAELYGLQARAYADPTPAG